MWPWWVKIPIEAFTDVILAILMEMILEVMSGVVDLEVDKVADMAVKTSLISTETYERNSL